MACPRAVEDAPELALPRPDPDRRRRRAVDRRLGVALDPAGRRPLKVVGLERRRGAGGSGGRQRGARTVLAGLGGGDRRIVRNIAQHDNALAQTGELRDRVGDALDHDRARHPVRDLPIRETVRVRVVPVQAGRLRPLDLDGVVVGGSGRDVGADHLVAGRDGRRAQAVKVQVGRRHHPEPAILRQVVRVVNADPVARMDANRRRDLTPVPEERGPPVRVERRAQRE